MNSRVLAVATLLIVVAIVGGVFAVMAFTDNPAPQPAEQGKPDIPYTVTLSEVSRDGVYRDLKVTIRTETDLPSAQLVFVPFDGVEVIGEPPAQFVLLDGAQVFFNARIRLNANGDGAFTAEVIARFANDSTLVANDSLRFRGGERVSADFKPFSERVNPISVQEVPARPANGGAK